MLASQSRVAFLFFLHATACAVGRTGGDSSDKGGTTAASIPTAASPGAGSSASTTGVSGLGGTTTAGSSAPLLPIPNTMAGYAAVGRFSTQDANTLLFALPTTRLGGNFTGTSLAVRLADTGYDFFDVVIDGAPFISLTPSASVPCTAAADAQVINPNVNAAAACIATTPSTAPQVYAVAQGLKPGNHTAWLIKRTEFYQGTGTSAVGQTSFYGFVLDTNATLLTPPPPRTRRIDFVGDSGFTGYGAGQIMHNSNDYCDFSPATQNAASSVPYYTGELLHADIINISSSGQGVVNGVYDANPNHLLPRLFEETLPPAPSPVWGFTPAVNVVVVAGGGDDLNGSSGSGSFADPQAFVAGYAAWLAQIRTHYPQAFIVCALTSGAQGGDIATLGGAIQQAVALRKNTGDNNIAYFNFFMYDPNYTTYDDIAVSLNLYYGCKYHPSPAGAAWLAQRLSRFIGEKVNWDVSALTN